MHLFRDFKRIKGCMVAKTSAQTTLAATCKSGRRGTSFVVPVVSTSTDIDYIPELRVINTVSKRLLV
jgi:hypothetical protein